MGDKATKRKSGALGAGCLILFGLPFLAVGVFMTGLTAVTVARALKMRGWEPTPARILSVALESHRGDDGTTYEVKAEYEYVFDGVTYRSTRVSLHGGSDNIGNFHENAAKELKEYLPSANRGLLPEGLAEEPEDFAGSSRPFMCFVDPDEPAEAILYRNLRVGLLVFQGLFAVVFGGAGAGIVFAGIVGSRKAKAVATLVKAHPDEPWLARPDWAEGRIKASAKAGMVAMIAFAVFWNLVALPVLFFLPGEVAGKGNYLALIALVFPLVGIGLAAGAIRAAARYRKYGESVFELASTPGVVGGKLAGVIHISRHLEPEGGFIQTLSCVRRSTTGSGDNRSTSESVLWQEDKVLAGELTPDDQRRSTIPVLFGIPHEAVETAAPDGGDGVVWRLEVRAKVPGIDYAAHFEVPVFRTAESAEDFVLDEAPLAAFLKPGGGARDVLAAAGIQVALSPRGGTVLRCGMARNPGIALGVTLFALVWTGAIVLMWTQGAPAILSAIFAFLDVFILLWMFNLWFRAVETHAGPGGLAVRSTLLGIGRTLEIPVETLAELESTSDMQAGNRKYYRVVARTTGGARHPLVTHLGGMHLANAVVAVLREAMPEWEG